MKKSLLSVLLLLSATVFGACDEESLKAPAFYPHSQELAKMAPVVDATANPAKPTAEECLTFGTALNSYYENNTDSLKTSVMDIKDGAVYKKVGSYLYILPMAVNIKKFYEGATACKDKGVTEFTNAYNKLNSIEGFNQALLAGVEYSNSQAGTN